MMADAQGGGGHHKKVLHLQGCVPSGLSTSARIVLSDPLSTLPCSACSVPVLAPQAKAIHRLIVKLGSDLRGMLLGLVSAFGLPLGCHTGSALCLISS
jgi:hypothetical protein